MIEKIDDIVVCCVICYEVFVIEQYVLEVEEWDGCDGEVIYLIVCDDSGVFIGMVWLLLEGVIGKIGCVVVLKVVCGSGIGVVLICVLLQELVGIQGIICVKLGVQIYVIGFYEKLGFFVYGFEYLDVGIVYCDMIQEL